jgi:hypothetical protein
MKWENRREGETGTGAGTRNVFGSSNAGYLPLVLYIYESFLTIYHQRETQKQLSKGPVLPIRSSNGPDTGILPAIVASGKTF